MSLHIVRAVADLRAAVSAWHREGLRVALVPTMGALHDGHMSLVKAGLDRADRVIVTLFVNPKQFNNPRDLDLYPRTETEDALKLSEAGAHVLFAPGVDEMYPHGFSTRVIVEGVSEGLCGAYRPGHFEGVATVVSKLLLQAGADCAIFGEKDYQQLLVIKRLVRDLDIPVEIVGSATIREEDGLAMSSRNQRLSAQARVVAPVLHREMVLAAQAIRSGEPVAEVLTKTAEKIVAQGYDKVEYLEMREAETLAPLDSFGEPARLLAAAWLDDVRLIDNIAV